MALERIEKRPAKEGRPLASWKRIPLGLGNVPYTVVNAQLDRRQWGLAPLRYHVQAIPPGHPGLSRTRALPCRPMALVPPLDLPAEEVRALLAPLRNDLSIAI